MPFVERAGKPTLHYSIDDFTDPWLDAPYVILQHGFGRSGRFWYNWVPYLSRFYKVVRPDLRGLGQSTKNFDPNNPFTAEDYIDDVVALINQLGSSVHYCGESAGGLIGIILAGKYPDLVRTLTLVAAPLSISAESQKMMALDHPTWQDALRNLGSQGWAAAMNGELRFPPGTHPGLQKWFADEMGKNNVESLIAMSRAVPSAQGEPYLSKIKAPVLGLYPQRGRSNDDTLMNKLKSQIVNINILELSCKYHAIQMLEPAVMARHMLYFVAQHDGRPCEE
jgi:3-oxoadipate enol-lactonase